MLALLKLLFAILLLLNVAVFLLFIFWPADSVKQIHETLADVNITERYFSGYDGKSAGELKPKDELQKSEDWKELSPKDLKVYLSERGVELTKIDSVQYLGEILGGQPSKSVNELNLLRPEGRDLSAGSLGDTTMIIQSTEKIFVSKIESTPITSNKNLEKNLSKAATSKMLNVTSVNYSNSISEEQLFEDQLAESEIQIAAFNSVANSSIETNVYDSLAGITKQSSEVAMQVRTQLIENNPVLEGSLLKSSIRPINSETIAASNALDSTSPENQPQSMQTILTNKSNKQVHVSEHNKVYELNALIYNPLELPQPESIFVECCDDSSLKVYLPANLIENTDGTYLSQDHLELWFDRASIKPRVGYGKISHQFGIGLRKEPWVIDFLQNDSDWKLNVSVIERGDILVVTIENIPPDLRAWNIVFSKAVKEGKNWVQGQLISAVEKFTWGNPDRLIPLEAGSKQNATQ